MRLRKSIVAFLLSLCMMVQAMPVMAADGDATKIQAELYIENTDGSGTIVDGCTVRGGIRLLNYTDTNTPEITGFEAGYKHIPIPPGHAINTSTTTLFSSDYAEVKEFAKSSSLGDAAYFGASAARDYTSSAITRGNVDLLSFTTTYYESDTVDLSDWGLSLTLNDLVTSTTSGATLILYAADGSKIPATASTAIDKMGTTKTVDKSKSVFIQPTKREYNFGDSWDFSDGGFNIVYSDGSEKFYAIDNSEISGKGFSTETIGTQYITLTHTENGVTITGTIKVKVNANGYEDTIVEVNLTPPAKLVYNVGDTVDLTGGKMTVVYESGKTEDIALTKFFKSSDLALNNAGTKTLCAAYLGFTRSFTVTVNGTDDETKDRQPVSGKLTAPTKTTYEIGDCVDPTGGYWTITYDNGDTEKYNLSEIMTFGPLTVAGKVPVVCQFLGFEEMFYVNVAISSTSGLKEVKFVEPTQLEYMVGDVLNPKGSYFLLTYEKTNEDGTTSEFSNKVTLSSILTELPKFTEAGEREITVTYEGITQKFKVTVLDGTEGENKTLEKLEVTKNPDKMTYNVGDTFDPTGGVVTATYSDGSTEDIAMADFFANNNIDPALNNEGVVTFTFRKSGVTVDFQVTVGVNSGNTTGGDDSNSGDDSNTGDDSGNTDTQTVVDAFKDSLSQINIDALTTDDLETVYNLLAVYNNMTDDERAELSDEETDKVLALAEWYLANASDSDSKALEEAETAAANASPATGVDNSNMTWILVGCVALVVIGGVAFAVIQKKKKA